MNCEFRNIRVNLFNIEKGWYFEVKLYGLLLKSKYYTSEKSARNKIKKLQKNIQAESEHGVSIEIEIIF